MPTKAPRPRRGHVDMSPEAIAARLDEAGRLYGLYLARRPAQAAAWRRGGAVARRRQRR